MEHIIKYLEADIKDWDSGTNETDLWDRYQQWLEDKDNDCLTDLAEDWNEVSCVPIPYSLCQLAYSLQEAHKILDLLKCEPFKQVVGLAPWMEADD